MTTFSILNYFLKLTPMVGGYLLVLYYASLTMIGFLEQQNRMQCDFESHTFYTQIIRENPLICLFIKN